LLIFGLSTADSNQLFYKPFHLNQDHSGYNLQHFEVIVVKVSSSKVSFEVRLFIQMKYGFLNELQLFFVAII
jgi:hypothetical protein